MKTSHILIARWKLWQFPLTILLALTLAANVLAAPLDSSRDLDTSLDNDGKVSASVANILSSAQSTYTLTVSTVGSGSVTKQPDQLTYLAGTFVNLSATAVDGFTFSGWSGPCTGTGICSVTMDSAKRVTATFSLISARPNDPPSFTSTPLLSTSAGANYTYSIVANDPDAGDILTISAPAKPSWMTLTPTGDGTAILAGMPSSANLGAQVMRLRVQDTSGAFASQEFFLIVAPPDPTATGSIQGMVVDADGNGLGGAMVTQSAAKGEVVAMTMDSKITDNNGSYRFDAVPPGDYTITVSLNAQVPDALIAVNVLPGQPAVIPAITLQDGQPSLRLPLLYR